MNKFDNGVLRRTSGIHINPQCYYCDEVQMKIIGETHSNLGKIRNARRIFSGNAEGKTPRDRPRRR
jgi:hypothetical protein